MDHGIMDNLTYFLAYQRENCETLLRNFNETNSCPPSFDGIYCWPATPSNSAAQLPCLAQESKDQSISRWCSTSIAKITNYNQSVFEWYPPDNTGCPVINSAMQFFNAHSVLPNSTASRVYSWNLRFTKYQLTGYMISIISLVTALSIFALIPKLQNGRVRIHINLFMSLTFLAIIWFLQILFYGQRVFIASVIKDTYSNNDPSIPCRVLNILSRYFEVSSFIWILMESWYFYNFICRAPYKENTTVKPLLVCGWGLPIIVMIPYVYVYARETKTNFCWVDVDNKAYIITVPLIFIVMINACFFFLNVRVLFIKLNCSILHQRKQNFWRWLKSTLMLMPLFGAHETFYLIDAYLPSRGCKIKCSVVLRLTCAFKGLVVSTLYCFMNTEVRTEVRRAWENWQSSRSILKRQLKTRKLFNHEKFSNLIAPGTAKPIR